MRALFIALSASVLFSGGFLIGFDFCVRQGTCGASDAGPSTFLWTLGLAFAGSFVPAITYVLIARYFRSMPKFVYIVGMSFATALPFLAVGLLSLGTSFLAELWIVTPIVIGAVGAGIGCLLAWRAEDSRP